MQANTLARYQPRIQRAKSLCVLARHGPPLKRALEVASRVSAAGLAAVSLSLLGGSVQPSAVAAVSPTALSATETTYEREIHKFTRPKSHLPLSDEQAALQLLMDPDMFTHDSWAAMMQLQQYAQYVEGLAAAGVEDAPGCDFCTANRMVLEKAWQVSCIGLSDAAATVRCATAQHKPRCLYGIALAPPCCFMLVALC